MTEPLRSTLKSKLPALVGATIATVLVTVFSSYLGVKGTLVGLALSTALTGVLSTVSEHTVHRTTERARLRWHGYHVNDPYKKLYKSQQRNIPYRLILASMGVVGLASVATILVIQAAAGNVGTANVVLHPARAVRRSGHPEHRTQPVPSIPASKTPSKTPSATITTLLPTPTVTPTPSPTSASTPSPVPSSPGFASPSPPSTSLSASP